LRWGPAVADLRVEMRDETDRIKAALSGKCVELGEHYFGPVKKASRGEVQFENGPGSLYMNTTRKPGAWFAFSGDIGGYGLELIMWQLDCSFADALSWAKNWLGGDLPPLPQVKKSSKPEKSQEQEDREKIAFAQGLDEQSTPPDGTWAAGYLEEERGIKGPFPPCVHFIGKAPVSEKYPKILDPPAALFLSTDIDGNVQAVGRVFLDGSKKKPGYHTPKRTNGVKSGAAVKFSGNPDGRLVSCEAPEDALSIVQAGGYETWATLGISDLAKAPYPEGREITLARDRDKPGSPADKLFRKTVTALLDRDFDVYVATPPEGVKDFNALLTRNGKGEAEIREGEAAIRAAINSAESQKPKAHFEFHPVPLDEAVERIDRIVQNFLDNPEHTGIKGTAGIGKTLAFIKGVANHPQTFFKNIGVFLPTHALVNEWAARLKSANSSLEVQIIRGRGQVVDGEPMCRKSKLAEKIGRMGFSVQRSLCAGKDADGIIQHCEFNKKDECPYQRQFVDAGLNRRPAIFIMALELLYYGRQAELPKLDFAVTDETFFAAATREQHFIIDRLSARRRHSIENEQRESLMRLSFFARDALEQKKPLIAHLKAKGVSVEEVKDAANIESGGRDTPPVTPGMSQEDQDKAIADFQRGDAMKLKRFWILLAEEWELGRDDVTRISLREWMDPDTYETQTQIYLHWKKEIDRLKEIPTLCLDADLDIKIVEKFFPGITVHTVEVERNCEVIQVNDTAAPNGKFLGPYIEPKDPTDEQKIKYLQDLETAERRCADVQNLIDVEASTGARVLVIANQKVAEKLKAPKNGDKTNFGAFRGVDKWRDFDTAIIVGREQAKPIVYESQARALFWDRPEPLKFLPHGRLLYERRFYRMKDGSVSSAEISVHPDPDIQRLIEQQRELQIAQAIDRLRCIHNVRPKRVILVTSLPCPITVDRVMSWRGIIPANVEVALTRKGVLPLSWSEMARCFPDIWTSAGAAEQELRREGLSTYETLKEYLLGKRRYLISVEYRRPKQRGSPTKALLPADSPDPRAALEAVVGELVSFKVLDALPAAAEAQVPAEIPENLGPIGPISPELETHVEAEIAGDLTPVGDISAAVTPMGAIPEHESPKQLAFAAAGITTADAPPDSWAMPPPGEGPGAAPT